MMRKLLNFSLFFVLLFSLISCSTTRNISYNKDDIRPTGKNIPIRVELREFADIRLEREFGKLQSSQPRKIKKNKKTVCVNSENHYKKNTLAAQFTKQIAEHFDRNKLFLLTTFQDSEFTDYYLTGDLVCFFGEQDFSTGALVGSQFGLIGAAMTAGIKTHGDITIEIANLKLYNKDGELVKDLGSFKQEYSEKMSADGYCWCIYSNINNKLKDFNQKLSDKIYEDLKDIQSSI